MAKKIPVAVLAATGSVGQRFVQLLDGHPWFEVVALTGSDRTVGRRFGEAVHWVLTDPMPEWAGNLEVLPTDPQLVQVPLVFSALPANLAVEAEPAFAKQGAMVCSNASSYRKDPDVPILLPEVNPDHTSVLQYQRKRMGLRIGGIVTNPNCTSTGMTVALKAVKDAFGLRKVFAVSMQALSGAGYPGIPSLDILDNVVPFIGGEDEKVEWEPLKMLGQAAGDKIELADFTISAHTNRVAVSDGHLVCLSVECDRAAEVEEVRQVLSHYSGPEISRNLPSAPANVIIYREENDRPQPRLDRMTGKGMATVVGKLRKDPLFHIKMLVLSHNTIRGAAGGSIFNAELLVKQGWVS
jgi:aspartate-semialdehyde dehydrogenase